MRVVCWNVHGCVGTDGRFDPERTAQTLARLAPDLALLQEVGDNTGRHPPVDQASAIAHALGLSARLGITLSRSAYGYGNVTLARADAGTAETWDLSVRGREPRVCLCVELPILDGLRLRSANVHLGLGRRERRVQLQILLDEAGPLHGWPELPALVGGDWNDWPPGPVSRTLASAFRDAALLAGGRPAATWPSRRPLLRLDRLYVGAGLAVREFAVDDSPEARAASDHLPLICDVAPAVWPAVWKDRGAP